MRISIIVAKSLNNVIGKENKLPWKLSDDLANFKKLTTGHYILMGRKTFESLGKPLPGRVHLVVSSKEMPNTDQVLWFSSLFKAMKYAERQVEKELFVIGGSQIYKAALPLADRLYLTDIQAEVNGDAFFPVLSSKNWNLISEQQFSKNTNNDFDFSIKVLDRKKF